MRVKPYLKPKKEKQCIIDHTHPAYKKRQQTMRVGNQYNGAYYYSKEIVDNIIPIVKTDRNWVTINIPGYCCDHSIVFIHNNLDPNLYSWLEDYEDLILVCGVPSTCDKVKHLGTPIYLPLSVDVSYVEKFIFPFKTKDIAFVGRRVKRHKKKFQIGTKYLENMPRDVLLKNMAKFKKVYAVGRCAIEAKILGCEVLPYDDRFPDPSFWKILDNKEAAYMLQHLIDNIDKRGDTHED